MRFLICFALGWKNWSCNRKRGMGRGGGKQQRVVWLHAGVRPNTPPPHLRHDLHDKQLVLQGLARLHDANNGGLDRVHALLLELLRVVRLLEACHRHAQLAVRVAEGLVEHERVVVLRAGGVMCFALHGEAERHGAQAARPLPPPTPRTLIVLDSGDLRRILCLPHASEWSVRLSVSTSRVSSASFSRMASRRMGTEVSLKASSTPAWMVTSENSYVAAG